HTRFSRDWSSDVCSSDLFAHPQRKQDEPWHPVGYRTCWLRPRSQKSPLAWYLTFRRRPCQQSDARQVRRRYRGNDAIPATDSNRSEEHTSELQSRENLVC